MLINRGKLNKLYIYTSEYSVIKHNNNVTIWEDVHNKYISVFLKLVTKNILYFSSNINRNTHCLHTHMPDIYVKRNGSYTPKY